MWKSTWINRFWCWKLSKFNQTFPVCIYQITLCSCWTAIILTSFSLFQKSHIAYIFMTLSMLYYLNQREKHAVIIIEVNFHKHERNSRWMIIILIFGHSLRDAPTYNFQVNISFVLCWVEKQINISFIPCRNKNSSLESCRYHYYSILISMNSVC